MLNSLNVVSLEKVVAVVVLLPVAIAGYVKEKWH
jgi:hypothetical protein